MSATPQKVRPRTKRMAMANGRSTEGSSSLPCPYCKHEASAVVDSRPPGIRTAYTRRRRQCVKCQRRFTTLEVYEDIVKNGADPDEIRAAFRSVLETLIAALA